MEVLADHAVKASFFLALGPDHSGLAIFRIFRQRGFLEKMWRTRAPALYGVKTMCDGTLLRGPKIGAAAPPLAPQLAAAGMVGTQRQEEAGLDRMVGQDLHEGGHPPTKTLQGVHVDFDG